MSGALNWDEPETPVYQALVIVALVTLVGLVALVVALNWHRVFGPRLGGGLTLVTHGGLPPNQQGVPGWFVWAKADRDIGTHFLVVADAAIPFALGTSERPAENFRQSSVPCTTARVTRSILRFPYPITEGSSLGIEVFAPGDVRITSVKPCQPEGEPFLFRPSWEDPSPTKDE
jgi:hypothetical protein